MNRSSNQLPDAEVLRQTRFGSKVISFAAVVFLSNGTQGCSNGPPEGNGGW